MSAVDIAEVETAFGAMYRDAYRRAEEKIRGRQLGEAFIDLPEQPIEWRAAA